MPQSLDNVSFLSRTHAAIPTGGVARGDVMGGHKGRLGLRLFHGSPNTAFHKPCRGRRPPRRFFFPSHLRFFCGFMSAPCSMSASTMTQAHTSRPSSRTPAPAATRKGERGRERQIERARDIETKAQFRGYSTRAHPILICPPSVVCQQPAAVPVVLLSFSAAAAAARSDAPRRAPTWRPSLRTHAPCPSR